MKDIYEVEKILTNYLGFDVMDFVNQGDPIIFGGAVRDAISGDSINDVDVLVGSRTFKILTSFLEEKGFEKENREDLDELYSDLKIIFTPRTFTKENVIIQLIRPRMGGDSPPPTDEESYRDLIRFMVQVDLSCCGVGFSSSDGFFEIYPGAAKQCHDKVFNVFPDNKLHVATRIDERIKKLTDRGWKKI